jgi:hypothetical protein
MRKSKRLPTRFPVGTKYVLEGRGALVSRHIEFPDGRRLELAPRASATCICLERETSVVPAIDADRAPPRRRRARVPTAA